MLCNQNRMNTLFLTTSQERKLQPWNCTNYIIILFGFLYKEVHDRIDKRSEIIKEKIIQLQVQICIFFFFIQQMQECQVFTCEVVHVAMHELELVFLLDCNASSTYFPPWTEKEL